MLGKVVLSLTLIPEVTIEVVTDVVANDGKVVMFNWEALIVDAVVGVDRLWVEGYVGISIPLVHVAKSTLQLFVVQRHIPV